MHDQDKQHDGNVLAEARVLRVRIVQFSPRNPTLGKEMLVLFVSGVFGTGNIIHGLEHQGGNGEEDGVVEIVFPCSPFGRLC